MENGFFFGFGASGTLDSVYNRTGECAVALESFIFIAGLVMESLSSKTGPY